MKTPKAEPVVNYLLIVWKSPAVEEACRKPRLSVIKARLKGSEAAGAFVNGIPNSGPVRSSAGNNGSVIIRCVDS